MTVNTNRRWLEVAKILQRDGDSVGIGQSRTNERGNGKERTHLDRLDEIVTMSALALASRKLFKDGHYARAVEEAFKCLDNLVKQKSGLSHAFGADLMRTAFSPKKPILKLSNLLSNSQKDEQQGYMEIFAGVMTGIRNPRAHEHELVDDPEVALEMLVMANHLVRKLECSSLSLTQEVPPTS